MGRVVGIDLGTTNTAVAVLLDGKPKIIEDERGYKVLPSCVSAKGDGRFIVGHAAYNLILTRPGRTVYATKRLIGRKFDSPEVQEARKRMQYQLREAPDGGVQVQVGDAWMSPVEVAAIILQVVKSVAERSLGDTVESCIITVPAYFNHVQRQATLEAAQLAGLHCERLLNEPTAAALAYGFKKNINRTILVFDLGGGTFDVSVLRIGDGLYETLSTVGDTYLGGEDFDFRIVEWMATEFQKLRGIDLRSDRHTLQRLKDAAERAKCEISFAERTVIQVPHVTPTDNLELTLTRTILEGITHDLVERCLQVCRQAVQEAGLSIPDIDEIVLVGGQSRMPRMRAAVTTLFGKDPSRTVHPEEAVAVGASIHAGSLDDPDTPAAVLLDVTPFDLGIDAAGGLFTPVVQRNSRVPCSETRTFVTARDNQDTVKIVVRQGASRVASENEFLGEFVMTGLTHAPRFQTRVDVAFRLDTNGILHVTAIEKGTQERKQIVIRNYAQRAQTPSMPSADEAMADREARAKEDPALLAAQEVARDPASATASKNGTADKAASNDKSSETNGTQKKLGFFQSLFGRKPQIPAPGAAAAGAAAGAASAIEPVISAVGAAGMAGGTEGGLATINLSHITPPPDPIEDLPEAEATELVDDEVVPLEASKGLAQFGLAGEGFHEAPTGPKRAAGDDPFGNPFGATSTSKSSTLSSDDLFGGDIFGAPPSQQSDPALVELEGESLSAEAGDEGEGMLVGLDESIFADTTSDVTTDSTGLDIDLDSVMFGSDFSSTSGKSSDQPGSKAGTNADSGLESLMFLGADDDLGSLAEDLARQLESDLGNFGSSESLAASNAASGTSRMSSSELQGAFPDYPDEDAETPDAPLARGGTQAIAVTPVHEPSDLDGIDFLANLPYPKPLPEPVPEPLPGLTPKSSKPARIKLNYKRFDVFVSEYRENLRRGGAFIKADKPLAIGRACVFEIRIPGVDEPVIFDAVVTSAQDGSDGQASGMNVEYRMDERQRLTLERLLNRA